MIRKILVRKLYTETSMFINKVKNEDSTILQPFIFLTLRIQYSRGRYPPRMVLCEQSELTLILPFDSRAGTDLEGFAWTPYMYIKENMRHYNMLTQPHNAINPIKLSLLNFREEDVPKHPYRGLPLIQGVCNSHPFSKFLLYMGSTSWLRETW